MRQVRKGEKKRKSELIKDGYVSSQNTDWFYSKAVKGSLICRCDKSLACVHETRRGDIDSCTSELDLDLQCSVGL